MYDVGLYTCAVVSALFLRHFVRRGGGWWSKQRKYIQHYLANSLLVKYFISMSDTSGRSNSLKPFIPVGVKQWHIVWNRVIHSDKLGIACWISVNEWLHLCLLIINCRKILSWWLRNFKSRIAKGSKLWRRNVHLQVHGLLIAVMIAVIMLSLIFAFAQIKSPNT